MVQRLVQTQEQKLIQQQRLTQQQMLQVRLLEMPLAELEQSVQAEIDDNPALETTPSEDTDLSESSEPDTAESYEESIEREERADALDTALQNMGGDDEMPEPESNKYYTSSSELEEITYGDQRSFYDQLKEQMRETELTAHQQDIMDGNGIVAEFLNRGDHFLMNLSCDKHQECEALFLVVILNHKVIEVCLVLHVLVKRFNAPAFFVSAENFFCRFGTVALQDVYTESFFALFKLFLCISGTPKFHAVLVVVAAFFIFIDVTKDINVGVIGYPPGHIFDPGMFLARSIVETVCILDILHGIPEDICIGRNRNDISIVVC